MNLQTQAQIRELALKGLGYKKIATILDLPSSTVKSHLRRHSPTEDQAKCLNCGMPITQKPHTKTKKFCCDKCRMTYWNQHQDLVNRRAYYTLTCQQCGKEFTSYGNKNRKYCCRDCFCQSRRKAGV